MRADEAVEAGVGVGVGGVVGVGVGVSVGVGVGVGSAHPITSASSVRVIAAVQSVDCFTLHPSPASDSHKYQKYRRARAAALSNSDSRALYSLPSFFPTPSQLSRL